MVSILVISDTHRRIENAAELIKNLNPDYVLHLGDVASDCKDLCILFPKLKLISVLGNNDFFKNHDEFPYERTVNIAGKKIFMCHGHTYGVKFGYDRVIYKGLSESADAVLFGHTHTPYLSNEDGMIVLNPGSTSTYGYITIENDKMYAKLNRF